MLNRLHASIRSIDRDDQVLLDNANLTSHGVLGVALAFSEAFLAARLRALAQGHVWVSKRDRLASASRQRGPRRKASNLSSG